MPPFQALGLLEGSRSLLLGSVMEPGSQRIPIGLPFTAPHSPLLLEISELPLSQPRRGRENFPETGAHTSETHQAPLVACSPCCPTGFS